MSQQLYVNTCIYTYIYIYIYIYTYTYMYTYTYTYMCVYMYVCVCHGVYICTHLRTTANIYIHIHKSRWQTENSGNDKIVNFGRNKNEKGKTRQNQWAFWAFLSKREIADWNLDPVILGFFYGIENDGKMVQFFQNQKLALFSLLITYLHNTWGRVWSKLTCIFKGILFTQKFNELTFVEMN